jgi:hypothetical protein
MRTLHQTFITAPAEPLELLAINFYHNCDSDLGINKSIQVIPVLAVNTNIHKQTYINSEEVEFFTEVSYITPRGEIKVDDFSSVYPTEADDDYGCIEVLALRCKGDTQVCLLEPSNEKSWTRRCSLNIVNPSMYTTHCAEESHPILVDLQKLEEDISTTFSYVTGIGVKDSI